MKKIVIRTMLGTIILEAILVCVFILMGNLISITAARALESVGIIFMFSIPCLFYSKIYDDEKYKYISIGGACLTFVAALISILNIWNLISMNEFLLKIDYTLTIIIWMLAFISCILSYMSINNTLDIFKKVSITLITLLSIWTALIVWTSFPEGFLARLFFVVMVLTIASFLCTVILIRVYKKEIDKVSQEAYNASKSQPTNVVQPTQSVSVANNSMVQNNMEQQNIQQIDNNQIQTQNSTPTEAANSNENFFDGWINNEQTTTNNPTNNTTINNTPIDNNTVNNNVINNTPVNNTPIDNNTVNNNVINNAPVNTPTNNTPINNNMQ